MVAIPELAKRIGCSVEEIFAITLRTEGLVLHPPNAQCSHLPGPTLNKTTTPADVRFHDDVSTYTGASLPPSLSLPLTPSPGVHADGHNPSFSPSSSRITLEGLLDRSPADNRGIKLSAEAAAAQGSSQKPKRSSPPCVCSESIPPPSSVCARPVIAGEGNKAGGIYDRLSQQDSYTGSHRERFAQPTGSAQNEFR
jgi:hypothetical protein